MTDSSICKKFGDVPVSKSHVGAASTCPSKFKMEQSAVKKSPEVEPPQPISPVADPSFTASSKLFSLAIKGPGAVESSRLPALVIVIGGVVVQILGLALVGWTIYRGGPELLKIIGPVATKIIGH